MKRLFFFFTLIFLLGIFVAWQIVDKGGSLQDPSEISGEIYYSNTSADEIILEDPYSGKIISSPLFIAGQARGSWFFEASAPVVLTNWDGLIIAEGTIHTTKDWMTNEFVPFEGTLLFETPSYGDIGSLILQNDNPSGLPVYDKAIEIPIRYH